ncbi:hypothetical protein F0P96_06055 [Hymenobacter busanensis]|uniref:Uncharacterized protein n=1 Tax=Hymenobacter busanensis TaxID=2607656 RepID=A0A7L5A1M1_9BACT|nr:hypothetical protein [Hymenobacter busanensis]KAA9338396.1 hypothetical protein F0P96_06055 [Hymenobacter busanensis]QHJ09177.1 hypothetical protein GUY19_18550 [Hymenobacter busanensis]
MKRLLLWALLLAPMALWAQPTQPARLELRLDPDESDVRVLPLADSTVALLVESPMKGKFQQEFALLHYDQQLRQRRRTPLPVPKEYQLTESAAELPYAYALFQSNYTAAKLLLLRVDLRTGALREYSFDTEKVDDIYSLEALSGNLFASVEVDGHLTVLHLDIAQEQYRLLTSLYEPLPAQLTFLADSVSKRLAFVLSQSNGLRSRLQIKQLSAQGQLLASQFVQAESERGLITAELSPGDSASRLLTGTYTLRDPRFSQGLFATDLTPSAAVRAPLRFYDFLSLKHFFDYMKPARAERMRARSAKRRAAGREMRLHYRLLTHRLLPFQSGYVLVGEVYYPHYRYDSPYGTMLYALRAFDGYRSTQAIVCGFDSTGTLLWDNSFLLKNADRYTLTETVRVRPLPDGQRLALAYLDEEQLRYKIIDRTTPAPNDLQVPLLTNLEGKREKTVSTNHEGILPWVGSRFLAYGYQRVRPEHGESRLVFFVNAVAFE